MKCACAILSSVACPGLHNKFSHYLTNGTVVERKLLNIKCLFRFSLQLLPGTFLIIRIIEKDIIKVYIGLFVKYPLFSLEFNET